MFIRTLFLFFMALSAPINAFVAVEFSPDSTNWDGELKRGFETFKKDLAASSSYNNTITLVDYVAYVASYSKNELTTAPVTALVLDYFIKTGGPFGISKRSANALETFILTAALIGVVKTLNGLPDDTYNILHLKKTDPIHLECATEIQKKYLHQINLSEATDPYWQSLSVLVDAMQDRDFFVNDPGISQPAHAINFLNDVYLFAFLMNVVNDIHGRSLDAILSFEKGTKETQHNYVQWIFPLPTVGMGDGARAPRVTDHSTELLKRNPQVLEIIQNNMRRSFASMVDFWGQKSVYDTDTPLKLELSKDGFLEDSTTNEWQNNWINKTHNYLRMTRFLESLKIFGLLSEQAALFTYLESIYNSENLVPEECKNIMSNSMNNFWNPHRPT